MTRTSLMDVTPEKSIYLDNHATTPTDCRVVAAMAPFLSDHFGNPHSADHVEGWHAQEAIETAAQEIASTIEADPDEIIFTSGATEANNLAILGLARRAPPFKRRILVSSIEHKSVLASAEATLSMGFSVEFLPVHRDGVIDRENLARRMGKDILLVSVQAVNSEVGTVQPIKEIASLSHEYGAFFHSDAAQALAADSLDTGELHVDLMSLSGHKIYGPKGIGALYVRRDVQNQLEPIIYGGGQQGGLRSGTLPVPLCVGLAKAITIMAGPEAEAEREYLSNLRDLLVDRLLSEVGQISLNGPVGKNRHPGNASLRFPGFDGRDILAAVQPQLAASTGSACTSGIPAPSHVLKAIGLSDIEAESSIRFCVGRFTTEAEILATVSIIVAALKRVATK